MQRSVSSANIIFTNNELSASQIKESSTVTELKMTMNTEMNLGGNRGDDCYGLFDDFENGNVVCCDDEVIVVSYNGAPAESQPPPPISTIHIVSDGDDDDDSVLSSMSTIPDDDDDSSLSLQQQHAASISFGVPSVPNTTLVSLKGSDDEKENEEEEECLSSNNNIKRSTSLVSFSELVKMEHVDNFRLSLKKGERDAVWYTDQEMTKIQNKVLAKGMQKEEEQQQAQEKKKKKKQKSRKEKKKKKISKNKIKLAYDDVLTETQHQARTTPKELIIETQPSTQSAEAL